MAEAQLLEADAAAGVRPPRAATGGGHHRRRPFDLRHQYGFPSLAIICFAFLYAPILLLACYSFNSSSSLTRLEGFSLQWFVAVVENEEIRAATWVSIRVATLATVVSTMMATAAALATTRVQPFRGQAASYLVINFPLLVPEIITAIATLSFFAVLGINRGFVTVVLAHICFCIPFAYMPIRARLQDMDKTLEQAAADLYATPWQAFRRITLPLLMPGIVAGGMLAFIVSIDDFIITSFVTGPGYTTLPIYIWTTVRNIVTPEVNAVSTILLLVSIVFVSLSLLTGLRKVER